MNFLFQNIRVKLNLLTWQLLIFFFFSFLFLLFWKKFLCRIKQVAVSPRYDFHPSIWQEKSTHMNISCETVTIMCQRQLCHEKKRNFSFMFLNEELQSLKFPNSLLLLHHHHHHHQIGMTGYNFLKILNIKRHKNQFSFCVCYWIQ